MKISSTKRRENIAMNMEEREQLHVVRFSKPSFPIAARVNKERMHIARQPTRNNESARHYVVTSHVKIRTG